MSRAHTTSAVVSCLLQVVEDILYHFCRQIHNLLHILLRNSICRRNEYVITFLSVHSSSPRIQRDTVFLFHTLVMHSHCDTQFRIKGLLCFPISHKFDPPEESLSSDITNVWVIPKSLLQTCLQDFTHLRYVLDKILLFDDSLYLCCCGTGDWMALVSLSMTKCSGPFI